MSNPRDIQYYLPDFVTQLLEVQRFLMQAQVLRCYSPQGVRAGTTNFKAWGKRRIDCPVLGATHLPVLGNNWDATRGDGKDKKINIPHSPQWSWCTSI
jgi:hypothetical protein